MSDALKPVFDYYESHRAEVRAQLEALIRIPSVSAAGFPEHEVTRCAQAVCDIMKEAGLTHTEVIQLPGVQAYAYGEWMGAGPSAKTLLLYGHHDVQPVGRPECWLSPPFEPQERNGRLYGRGSVDDKAGVMVHIAALAAYLKSGARCPVNIKFLVEGEEETGSDHLGEFLTRYQSRLHADYIVLTDTSNFATGIPALTYQLRGIVAADIVVSALKQPVHSGMWGGPTADPALALAKILARLEDDQGRIQIPGLYDDVETPAPELQVRLQSLPYDEARFREEAGILEGVQMAGEPQFTAYEQLWTRPALSVNALEASSMARVSNQIVDSAAARVGIRIVPRQDPEKVTAQLVDFLKHNPPHGVQVEVTPQRGTPWWQTNPEGPAFAAALRAMEWGYGEKPVLVGCGGSIGFVQPFSDALQGAPALLIGLEDPECHAHSENESLHLGDFDKAIRSAIYLYSELSSL